MDDKFKEVTTLKIKNCGYFEGRDGAMNRMRHVEGFLRFWQRSTSFFFKFMLFICLFLAVLGLHCCARAFSSCGKRGPLFIAVRGPLTIVASLVAEHRLQTRRLSSCGSRAQLLHGMWDPPRPGPNPCPLHWQADSQPLRHQGSPSVLLLDLGEV